MDLLRGTVQHYPWGTDDAIPSILGIPKDGRPFAEYWLGAHPLSVTQLRGVRLDSHFRENPEQLGQASRSHFGDQLPFLLKVLSARHALSLQAHPSREQAAAGWAQENDSGIALDAPERTYKDDWPKPELMVAINEFHTLCGFRDPVATAALFDRLGVAGELATVIGPLTGRRGPAALAEVFLDVLSLDGDRARLIDVVREAAERHRDAEGEVGSFARTVLELDAAFPGDPGILAALLLNRVELQPGEAVQIPAGCMHAHLSGTGIEVMANSDNVIRGGLTSKHIDVNELVSVLDFTGGEPDLVFEQILAPGVGYYPTPYPEFDLWRLRPDQTGITLPGEGSARVILVIDGEMTLTSPKATLHLSRGSAALLGADEPNPVLSGTGLAFLSAAGVR